MARTISTTIDQEMFMRLPWRTSAFVNPVLGWMENVSICFGSEAVWVVADIKRYN